MREHMQGVRWTQKLSTKRLDLAKDHMFSKSQVRIQILSVRYQNQCS